MSISSRRVIEEPAALRRFGIPAVICMVSVVLSLTRFASHAYRVFAAGTAFDDAYMFVRYANNVLAGHGIAWNPHGEAVYGVSSLAHLFLVTVMKRFLSLEDSTILSLASSLCALAAVVVLVGVCSRFSSALRGRPLLWAALLFPVLLGQQSFVYHALTGMDTMLALLCNSLLIYAVLRLGGRAGPLDVALVVGAAYLAFAARPDSGIYAVLFPLLFVVVLARPAGRWRVTAGFLAGLAGLLLLDALVKWAAFGDLLPLSYHAKQIGYYSDYIGVPYVNPVKGLSVFVTASLAPLAAIALFVRRRALPLLTVFLLPVLLTVAYYFSVVQIMALQGRFYFPSLPFVLVAGALVFDAWLSGLERRSLRPPAVVVRLVLASMLVFLASPALTLLAVAYEKRLMGGQPAEAGPLYETASGKRLPASGWYFGIDDVSRIAAGAPAGTRIAASEHGMLGARAPQVAIVDMVGLHDRTFAHRGFSAEELFRRQPDLIWGPHTHYVGMIREILSADALWDDYLFYPDAFAYGLAIRKESPHVEILSAGIERRWAERYPGLAMGDYLARPLRAGP